MSLIDKTMTFSMDWCPSCALAHVQSDNIAYKMFAWIVIITLKNFSGTGTVCKGKPFQIKQTGNQINFDLDITELEQHEAIKDVVNDINYWSFLPGFLQVQLDNNNIEVAKCTGMTILSNQTIEVIFEIN